MLRVVCLGDKTVKKDQELITGKIRTGLTLGEKGDFSTKRASEGLPLVGFWVCMTVTKILVFGHFFPRKYIFHNKNSFKKMGDTSKV